MGDMSLAVIVGRLTRDAELKYVPSGQAVCKFSVATNSRVKKGDQWVDESSYWNVDLWGKKAESLNQYLTKGKLVAVQGDMRQDKWEKDGQQQMKVLVTANDVQLLGGGSGEARQGGGFQAGEGRPSSDPRGGDPRPAYPSREGRSDNRSEGRGYPSAQAPRGGDRGQSPVQDDFTDDIPF